MSKSSMSTIFAIIFLTLIAGGYYWAWSSVMPSSDSSAGTEISMELEVSDISGMKEQANKLISGMENNANIPLPVPTEKLGKTNPFTLPE